MFTRLLYVFNYVRLREIIILFIKALKQCVMDINHPYIIILYYYNIIIINIIITIFVGVEAAHLKKKSSMTVLMSDTREKKWRTMHVTVRLFIRQYYCVLFFMGRGDSPYDYDVCCSGGLTRGRFFLRTIQTCMLCALFHTLY
jgi:hypothetical protein